MMIIHSFDPYMNLKNEKAIIWTTWFEIPSYVQKKKQNLFFIIHLTLDDSDDRFIFEIIIVKIKILKSLK